LGRSLWFGSDVQRSAFDLDPSRTRRRACRPTTTSLEPDTPPYPRRSLEPHTGMRRSHQKLTRPDIAEHPQKQPSSSTKPAPTDSARDEAESHRLILAENWVILEQILEITWTCCRRQRCHFPSHPRQLITQPHPIIHIQHLPSTPLIFPSIPLPRQLLMSRSSLRTSLSVHSRKFFSSQDFVGIPGRPLLKTMELTT
jgi:hypothetical protein